ncbi:MAG: hypothetical protein ACRD50_06825 [Candidatus Acidiferrales bacterium]
MRRFLGLSLLSASVLLLTGCPKGNQDYNLAKKAENVQDYDSALEYYTKALKQDPTNIEYRLRAEHLRFVAGQYHAEEGEKALKSGDLQLAVAEFQKARAIDPSNAMADQEGQKAMDALAAQQSPGQPKPEPTVPPGSSELETGPPELKPLSREPINIKMINDAKIVYQTIAQLAGLSVIFDPDFTSRRISIELPNVTLEQALDAVSIESKAFWKPVTSGIILVAPDQTQKRKDLEDEVVKTFYLSNTLTAQDLTEIVSGLRQVLNLTHLQQVNAQNAIIIRDTPDKIALCGRVISALDKAKPEVLLHVQVLEVSTDRARQLGIQPGTSAVVQFTPRTALQPSTSGSSSSSSSSTTTTSTPQVTLNNLKHLRLSDYSITLPGAAVTALLTDSATRIIQDPELRVSDGVAAKLRIGDRIPIATGSFQAGVGVGAVGTAGLVNPLVNTQFTYQDIGVNIDVTPRVHPEGDVSLKLKVEISSLNGTRNIGGIDQPVFAQRTEDGEIRLKDGEISILGGLMQRTETNSVNGWPGLAQIPFFRYFFSKDDKEIQEDEVLIVITPHVLRMPGFTAEDLRSIAAGTDTDIRVFREENGAAAPPPPLPPAQQPAPSQPPSNESAGQPSAVAPVVSAPATTPPATSPQQQPGSVSQAIVAGSQPSVPAQSPAAAGPDLRFDPASLTMSAGETKTIGLSAENVQDLFSIPILLQYNPAVIQIEEVRNGGFLSGGTQEIAIVQRVDQQHGQAIISATRQPNTPGINGTGTLFGLIVRAVGPGVSTIQILQVNARSSQQKPIPLAAGTVTIQVQ